MRAWDAQRVAQAAGAQLVAAPAGGDAEGPSGAGVDTRTLAAGELFVGLRGEREDGGARAGQALVAGAWGVLVSPEHAHALAGDGGGAGVVLAHAQPLDALHALARAWRRELRAQVLAVTGSTGKTSTKDILAAILAAQLRTVASPENLNTEIGLPLVVLGAPAGTQALVLEMGMRGAGQIAQLTAIAEPDVAVIVSVGPVHLEQLGSVEAVAAAKAELIAGLAPGATAVLPAGEPLLAAHRRADVLTVTFGEGGDVTLVTEGEDARDGEVLVRAGGDLLRLRPSFRQAHNLRNLLAAVAAAGAVGVRPQGELEVAFSSLRGERLELPGGVVVVNDCYNANPMSVRAALDDLARTAPGRRVAVLGDMLELGPRELEFHREIGAFAARSGVDLLIAVGPRASAMRDEFPGELHAVADSGAAAQTLRELLRDGDTVLVKGSRGVGLQRVAAALVARPVGEGRA